MAAWSVVPHSCFAMPRIRCIFRDAAGKALTEAMAYSDIGMLSAAIPIAESAGVDLSDIAEAQKTLSRLEKEQQARNDASASLQKAMGEADAAVLQKAIEIARECHVDEVLITEAKHKCIETAATALAAAMAGSDTDMLLAAITNAEMSHVVSFELDKAREGLGN